MGRKRKPFWLRDYKKASYNRRYYYKKKIQDKLTSIGVIVVGSALLFGWLFPNHKASTSQAASTVPLQDTQSEMAAFPHSERYKPDFNCSVDHSKDSIATMLCNNSEAAKHELIFDQAYYALRQTVGKSGWKALKQEVVNDSTLLTDCLIPSTSSADPACYIAHMDALTDKYKSRLTGTSLQEANRPIDQHITLQEDLINLGFLKNTTQVDGVYGEATRTAIVKWQKSNGDETADGFLSDSDAEKLSSQSTNIQNSQSIPQSTSLEKSSLQYTSNPDIQTPNNQSESNFLYYMIIFSIFIGALYVVAKILQAKAYQATWEAISKEIFSKKLNLQIARSQKITTDQYGTLQTDAWSKEINYFMKTRIDGIINSGINNEKLRKKLSSSAISLIIDLAADPLPVNAGTYSYISNPAVYDARMSPFDYEQHCALILRDAGWDAHTTQKSGDQGADVIAQKGNIRIVVQCKLYSGTVGNDAVQQAFSAQNFQGANGAIVATNSTFSQSARQIAATTGVILIHHSQLPTAAEEIYARVNNHSTSYPDVTT
ncbi:restriction endonuclease [Acetobacter vaccinii]|uniref:Restriction endonuclease n=1 Tax=Acetobacter vaccinii TaxID=2592655 RepID=A0A5C1YPG6_9PROT|nr:restriction endonuclease [Acetobacter vaccinii]QEO17861.1 hypothetical protein FLP30_09050 [Acetobacter vaccinii]